LSQINAVHVNPSYFITIHFTFILPPSPKLSKLSLSYMFPTKTLKAFLFSSIRATCSAHLYLLDLMIRIISYLCVLNQVSSSTGIKQPARAGYTEQVT
jgi:hypothetical protein